MCLKVIKRDGTQANFDKSKIINAISKAGYVEPSIKEQIAQDIEDWVKTLHNSDDSAKRLLSVESIQDMVEKKLMGTVYKDVAREYIRYRYKRELVRGNNKLHRNILEIVEHKNDYVNSENSNKNSQLLSTQRDYMAGEVSKDLTYKVLLPSDIVQAHKNGIIHYHDADYYAQTMHNCCLVNLEDMLQNGTVISRTLIEKPHSFHTACNVATQIVAQIASNQYGGQSITLSHLAPFVDISRQKLYEQVKEELRYAGQADVNDKVIRNITECRVREEVKKGVQTIQYQINTLMTTNGLAA